HANYELGGVDLPEHVKRRASETEVMAFSKKIMVAAKAQNKTVVFAPLRMPYKAHDVKELADVAIATFSYAVNITQQSDKENQHVTSYSLNALVDVILGSALAEGRSPVSLK
ncbi:MAG: beta-hexosaminidase, partial [Pseudomonadota bacterium]|nr:beta-hexosaminidase [Pseudomonadota bacterium]